VIKYYQHFSACWKSYFLIIQKCIWAPRGPPGAGSWVRAHFCTLVKMVLHMTPMTPRQRQRHWFSVHLRVTYKLAVLVFESQPRSDDSRLPHESRLSPIRSSLQRRCAFALRIPFNCAFLGQEQPTATAPSPLQAPGCGTVCMIHLNVSPRCAHSSNG
jgi:hypothetical protein